MFTHQDSFPSGSQVSLRLIVLLAVATISFGSVHGPSSAVAADSAPAVNEKFTDLQPAIQMLRAEVGQDRRDVVASAMLLTQSEAATFWPLYDEYRAAQRKVGDSKVKLITDFAANRDTMSEDEAAKLTKTALSLDKKKIDVKEDYVSKMSKVLSARTVARFFQIDNKLDAVVDAALAARVPLIK